MVMVMDVDYAPVLWIYLMDVHIIRPPTWRTLRAPSVDQRYRETLLRIRCVLHVQQISSNL